jgi:Bacterial Ig domain
METPTTQTPSRPTRRRLALVALGAALPIALLAAGCGSDGNSTASAGSATPTVAITSPTGGATVGRSFEVDLDVNFPIGEPDTGRDHVHLYYDGNRTEGQYGIAYAKTFTVTGLSPGHHEIEAVVAHADHSTTDSHSEPVAVTVTNSESGATGGTTATTSGNGGY